MPPNKDNIRKWVAALRSGEHEQGTGALNQDGKKCCLGVACIVAAQELPDLVVGNEDVSYEDATSRATYDGEGGYLPRSVANWLGLDGINPIILREGAENCGVSATAMNDARKHTFTEIADAIEKTYLTG